MLQINVDSVDGGKRLALRAGRLDSMTEQYSIAPAPVRFPNKFGCG